jgi:cell wall-associated NlpC family hydrolase
MPYVNRADLQLGDLVFYYSDLHHVSIYVGDGKVMTAPRSGDVVRMRVLGNNIHSFGRPG